MDVLPNLTYEDLQNKIVELETELNFFKNFQQKKEFLSVENASSLESNKQDVFKTILNTTPYIYAIKDINSVYIHANKSFCKFLGKQEEEIIGKTDYDFFPAKEAEEYIRGDSQVIAGGTHEKEEWEVLGSDGVTWLKVDKTVIFSDANEGKPIGVLCSVTDISLQKKMSIL